MGLFKWLKENSENRKKKKAEKAEKEKQVNKEPTEEELKNNKKGKLSYLWTFISIVVYVLGFGVVASAWQNSIALGVVAFIFVLVISPVAQTKAVNLAKEQRSINGKGKVALLLAYLLPTAILAMGFFFFVFGGMYSFDI